MASLSLLEIFSFAGATAAVIAAVVAIVVLVKRAPSLRIETGGKPYDLDPEHEIPPEDYGPWVKWSIRITNVGGLTARELKLRVVQEGTVHDSRFGETEVYWNAQRRKIESLAPRESKDWTVAVVEFAGLVVQWSHRSILFRKSGETFVPLPWYVFG